MTSPRESLPSKMANASAPYASVDPMIEKWVGENFLVLFRAFADREARFVYVSSNDGECFQISIEPPEGNLVTVNAWTVETLDDREMHQQWLTTVPDLQHTLQTSLEVVRSGCRR
jgi:hypothetical protein